MKKSTTIINVPAKTTARGTLPLPRNPAAPNLRLAINQDITATTIAPTPHGVDYQFGKGHYRS